MKTLAEQLEEVGGKIRVLDRELEENTKAVSACEARAGEVKRRASEIAAEMEKARGDRQTALAAEQDVKAISNRLRELGDSRELCEDEAVGLAGSLEGLMAERERLRAERRATAREIPLAKIRDAALRYNSQAAALAPVLAEIHALRAELREPPEGFAVQSPRGFVDVLPRMFLPSHPDILLVDDPEKQVFFEAQGVREKGRRAS